MTKPELPRQDCAAMVAAAHDRRIKTASATPEGHRVMDAINQGRRRLLDEALAGWSEQDRAALTRLTRRFADRMFALMQALDLPPEQAGEPEAGERRS
jgi:hypothetical protein